MSILAIDPGNIESAYAVMDEKSYDLLGFAKVKNEELVAFLKELPERAVNASAIEMIASYGMAVGASVFDTCTWIGRFEQVLSDKGIPVRRVFRREVKLNLCETPRAKDANVRQALIDRFAKHDFKNGKGTKQTPDWFYGVGKDVWQAIAVGVTFLDNMKKDSAKEW